MFWAPAPLNAKSWADVDDEDDDDYYATTAPIQPVWGTSEPQPSKQKAANVEVRTRCLYVMMIFDCVIVFAVSLFCIV